MFKPVLASRTFHPPIYEAKRDGVRKLSTLKPPLCDQELLITGSIYSMRNKTMALFIRGILLFCFHKDTGIILSCSSGPYQKTAYTYRVILN